MDYAFSRCAVMAASCALVGCIAPAEEVVGNDGMAEFEPLDGMPGDGPPVFEITVEAEIDPPYDRSVEGQPLAITVELFHCGAGVDTTDEEVRLPSGILESDDIGAVVIANYRSFADQDIYLEGAGPYTLAVVYDAEGTAVPFESDQWNGSRPEIDVFPRALDVGTALFEIVPGDPNVLMLHDPTARYDEDTQTLTTTYGFHSESGQEHSLTETYRFAGRHLAVSQYEPRACD